MAEPEAETPKPFAPPKKKKGGLVKILVFVALFVTAAGGGAAWWLLGTPTASAEADDPALETRGLVAFEPFLVNLADQGGNRFLKATILVSVESEESAKHVSESAVLTGHARSAILELLTLQSAPALVTPEGKEALKKAIKERVAMVLSDQKVLDVLFSEFVVQF